ncbi:MAG: acireductone synthase [Gammaproteobacteria bacterium]|nr:acireductone synthase [Gammaproteobacteria bacterium]
MVLAVVTDIEGTTSSLSFVKDVLFPYARQHLARYVAAHAQQPEVRVLLDDAKREAGGGLIYAGNDADIVAQLERWIDEDRKITPLKSLQGLIWEAGYRNGDFKGHIYADAAAQLRAWSARGIKLYVYSSGSVYAQKLLFGHSEAGDLTPLFSGYYDTHIGGKREADAYRAIVADIGLPAGEILFLSDIVEELDAAQAAGMRTIHLVRDGELDKNARHRQVRDFDAIEI